MSAAVEGRDEGTAHGQQHLAGDLVGIVLMGHDFPAIERDGLAAFQQLAKRLRTGNQRVRVLDEEREEALLLRHEGLEPCKHPTLAKPGRPAQQRAGGVVPGRP